MTDCLLLILALGVQASDALAQADLPIDYVSVGDYAGTANERIDAAIAAAMATDHKTVFFPNGTYALREGLQLNQGTNTELHLVGESQDGVLLVPDVPYLEANYNGGNWQAGGARLAHMINLSRGSVFESVDISIQNMTVDMRSQRVLGETPTYNVVGHGVRVGQGWEEGQFTVNHVTIRNVGSYGVGIQDRDGHPKNNVTLTNLHIERTGSDGIDTKEANGDGNRNLVVRNVSINEVGFLDTGAAPAIDVRYRDAVIENVNLVSQASRSTLPGQTSSTTGIVFRPVDNVDGGVIQATVSDIYIRGFNSGISVNASETAQHNNIAISDFRIQGQQNTGIGVAGNNHSGHTISDGFVDPAFGGAAVNAGGQATVTNVSASRWDPALTPLTSTTFLGNVSLVGDTFSPAWTGIVGPERVSLNPTSPSAGPFVFDVGATGVMQIDFDGVYNAMDRLVVDGTLNLGGELRINLIDDAPTTGRSFQVFEADTITGLFDTITLPSLGSGLFWDTDSLGIDGTLTLLKGNSLTLGDSNTSYNASSADDNPPLDAGFEADLRATYNPSWAFLGLDQTGRNDVRAMTFAFDPIAPESLDSVWIEARVLGENGYENDTMVLDAVGNNRSLASLEGFTTEGGWMTVRYDLDATEFDLLSDGLLNLAFLDDTRVDWVSLSWVLAEDPPTGVPGDFNNDGVVDAIDYTVWRDNLGAENESALNGNGSGSGGVDAADYDLWRQNFGVTSADAASLLTGVPEPSASVLGMLGVLAFGCPTVRRAT